MRVDERRTEIALEAVAGIPTAALRANVILDLYHACARIVAAVESAGGTGDAGIDGAAEAAWWAMKKARGDN